MQISKNLGIFSERLFISSWARGGGGGGGGGGCTELMGGNGAVSVTARGGGNSGGSTVEGYSTSKNRPSHHKYKSKTV